MPLQVHQKAPDFTLPSTSGKSFTLSTDAADRPLLLYFYPRDFTRVCTKEACGFRDNFSFFEGLDILILGINTDSVEKHLKFKKENDLPFDLLADVGGKVSRLYDAKLPFLNFSARVTYLLDKRHQISAVYSALFEADTHIQEMIAKIKKN